MSHRGLPVLAAGDVDDPGPLPHPLDDRQQQPGQQEVGEIVDAELILKAVLSLPVRRVLDPGTVDEDVHPALRLQHPRRELSDRVERGKLALFHLELSLSMQFG